MQADGCSLRDHLDAAARATGVPPVALQTPAPPPTLVYLLDWFQQLDSARQAGVSAPQPIGWCDMQAWAQLTQTPLQPWQADVLHRLDALWRAAWHAGRPKPPPTHA